MRLWKGLSLIALVAMAAGCGGDGLTRVPIQGTLTAEGAPVENATVQFIPAEGTVGEGAIGMTDENGKFTVISSRDSDAGVPPGKYRVRVTRLIDGDGTILPADAREADYPLSRESIPQPYSGMNTTLETTISDAGGEVKVEIPKKVPGKRKS
ncbi:MAG: carboxypeptidase-like regulatory domain-containing protein [Pirellulaceae bacterium]